MRTLASRTALFLALIFSSPRGMEAAIGNSSLQGNYSFALQRVDASVAGFFFTSASGTIAFDGTGGAAVQATVNRNGNVQPLSTGGAYSLESQGRLQLSVPALAASLSGGVSFDLNVLAATNVEAANLFSQEILLAVRQGAEPVDAASLAGQYFVVHQTITGSGSFQIESTSGLLVLGPDGSFTLDERVNRGGLPFTVRSSGQYQAAAAGAVSLIFAGRLAPVTFAFAPGGGFAFGANVSNLSPGLHELYAITKAGDVAVGGSDLGGSYQLMASSFNTGLGFATSMGRALYFSDGSAFYELLQNRTGVHGTAAGASFVEVAAGGEMRFGVPGVADVLQGGLGMAGQSFVASALPSLVDHNFVVAFRRPAHVAAASNAATLSTGTPLSPGALIVLTGENLAWQRQFAASYPLPTRLGGASVRINGGEARLLYLSPTQITAQVPFDLSPGTAQITVALDDIEAVALEVTASLTAPGIFTRSMDGQGPGMFLHGRGIGLVTEANPARPGEEIIIYATGLGAVVPPVADGAPAPSGTVASVAASVSVQIGGRNAEVSFARLAPGYVGLYELKVLIPPDIAPGPGVPVILTVGGVQSAAVPLPVGEIR